MVVATLIKAKYRLVNPDLPLPLPTRRGPVGVLCPVCTTPMKYLKSNEDSWLIGCPTPNNSHNWKWWRCDQLNHELALINLGAPRPIISSKSDWGPRVSPSGQHLEPKPVRNHHDCNPFHPYLQRPQVENTTTHHTSARAPRSKPVVKCQRSLEGPTAQSHKSAANKACLSQYCLNCCLAYGSPLCRQHPRTSTSGGTPPHQRHDLSTTSLNRLLSNPSDPTTSGTDSAAIIPAQSRAPASQSQPHQWAQASNSLGRRIDVESVALIQQLRAQRDREAELRANSLIDEKNMVTIHLWVNNNEKQAITAKFPQWPLARLDQSPLLVQAVIKAVGSQWNQALSFWDKQIYAWHDTLASYPHRFSSRTIVVRLQTVTVPENAIPPAMRNPTTTQPPPCAKEYRSSSDLPPIYDMPLSLPPATIEFDGHESQVAAELDSTASHLSLATTTRRLLGHEQTPSTPSTNIDSTQPLNDDIEAEVERTNHAEPSSSMTLKKRWPPTNSPVSSLLEWYQETVNGNVKQKWMTRWGGEWQLKPSTMYRYRLWIDEVTYLRFHAKYGSLPQASVGEARDFYKAEFNKVAYVKARDVTAPLRIQNLKTCLLTIFEFFNALSYFSYSNDCRTHKWNSLLVLSRNCGDTSDVHNAIKY
ncbi:uncharacterized protein MELLADRAFT_68153 [Melampsora larici-populina 98AG31]|uniref:Uncharacterized protein n=1 Tax=Melampsora larici-populina (strain 98AG31 / pathotype 3-4-7) TaxID=747676 RepID=F4S5R8_MELLP|nr:uncharacterized protein MELLADRAFT_68153 [Melampsora larici-populina 98AG31]EGF99946.1 hypothetical protein MELLADRAFT_68153 [Melampsora larici-populina 98AG31]